MTEPITQTLEVPGAVLAYDVRRAEPSTLPVLMLIGGPMGAAGFTTLAGHFADRTIVTYDPRGSGRSQAADGETGFAPDVHADDLHRLIEALDIGPVDLVGSSGGAVNGLALVASHPEDVRMLVAHEPPDAAMLPDRDIALAAARDIHDTYQRSGMGPAMAKFIALVSHRGPIPADYLERPAPDPAAYGMPTEDDGSRNEPMFGKHIVLTTAYQPDFDALRAAPTRIIVAVGEESADIMTGRAAAVVAERLGTDPVMFPGGHDGFLGGEYGQTGKPEPFAAKLREVLS
jgi:pimeloyl-ACP methyl ester carboxylesterase